MFLRKRLGGIETDSADALIGGSENDLTLHAIAQRQGGQAKQCCHTNWTSENYMHVNTWVLENIFYWQWAIESEEGKKSLISIFHEILTL